MMRCARCLGVGMQLNTGGLCSPCMTRLQQTYYRPEPPNPSGCREAVFVTEADVRRIVREELDRAAAAIAKEKQQCPTLK